MIFHTAYFGAPPHAAAYGVCGVVRQSFTHLLGKKGMGGRAQVLLRWRALPWGGQQKPDKHRCALESRDKGRGEEDPRRNDLANAFFVGGEVNCSVIC